MVSFVSPIFSSISRTEKKCKENEEVVYGVIVIVFLIVIFWIFVFVF